MGVMINQSINQSHSCHVANVLLDDVLDAAIQSRRKIYLELTDLGTLCRSSEEEGFADPPILVGQPMVEECCASDDANQCLGRYMGKKRGKAKVSFPTRYLLLNSLNLGGGNEGTCIYRFLPSPPPPDFVSKTFLGDITFLPRSIREPANSSKSTMVSTSLKALKVAPKMVGAGLENAATGSGKSERKRAASLLPQKPRISSNIDGRRGGLGHTVRN